MDVDNVIAAVIGAFFAVVVKPVVDEVVGWFARRRAKEEAIAARRRTRLEELAEAMAALPDAARHREAWARLPILASAIGEPELDAAVGRLLAADQDDYHDEVGNVSRTVGRLLKGAD